MNIIWLFVIIIVISIIINFIKKYNSNATDKVFNFIKNFSMENFGIDDFKEFVLGEEDKQYGMRSYFKMWYRFENVSEEDLIRMFYMPGMRDWFENSVEATGHLERNENGRPIKFLPGYNYAFACDEMIKYFNKKQIEWYGDEAKLIELPPYPTWEEGGILYNLMDRTPDELKVINKYYHSRTYEHRKLQMAKLGVEFSKEFEMKERKKRNLSETEDLTPINFL
jgi:hypothetical protein